MSFIAIGTTIVAVGGVVLAWWRWISIARFLRKILSWFQERWRPARTVREERLARESADFIATRGMIGQRRTDFAKEAARFAEYQEGLHLRDDDGHEEITIPFLTQAAWLPSQPIPLGLPGASVRGGANVRTVFEPAPGGTTWDILNHGVREAVLEHYGRTLLPEDPAADFGMRFGSYTDAIDQITHPNHAVFENRCSYRLLGIETTATGDIELRLGICGYFDYQNTGEVLCYEYAQARRDYSVPSLSPEAIESLWMKLPLRQQIGRFDDFGQRLAVPGVNNLTILRRPDRTLSFFLMKRGTVKRVQSAMGTVHVVPAGEFQPSSDNDTALIPECHVWYTLLREFAEEVGLMGRAESHTVDALSFETLPPFPLIAKKARHGAWRTYFLGIGIDPLSLKPEILTATLIEWQTLCDIVTPLHKAFLQNLESRPDLSPEEKRPMRDWIEEGCPLPKANPEGELMRGTECDGYPLNPVNLSAFIHGSTPLPAAMACLSLVKRHLEFFQDA